MLSGVIGLIRGIKTGCFVRYLRIREICCSCTMQLIILHIQIWMTLKLSDAFDIPRDNQNVIPALECTAIMLNINYGHNEELLNKCKRLKDYAYFVAKVKELKKTEDSLKDAIDKAIDECIKEEVLVDILLRHRTLAKNTLLTEYDEKKRRKLDRKEGFDDGLVQGELRGEQRVLFRIVSKKVKKNYTLDMIADDLEEEVEAIRPIYEKAKEQIKGDS